MLKSYLPDLHWHVRFGRTTRPSPIKTTKWWSSCWLPLWNTDYVAPFGLILLDSVGWNSAVVDVLQCCCTGRCCNLADHSQLEITDAALIYDNKEDYQLSYNCRGFEKVSQLPLKTSLHVWMIDFKRSIVRNYKSECDICPLKNHKMTWLVLSGHITQFSVTANWFFITAKFLTF